MTTTRKLATLAVLPVLAAAGQGTASAGPGQPGLAVPGEGQPGLSTAPAPLAAPSLADYIPDPPAPPARPRPQQQSNPQPDTLVQQPQATEPEVQQPESAPEVIPTDPHTLRAGNTALQVPDWIDTKTRDKAQAYLDHIEWQIAAGYDSAGFSRDESDRRAASTVTGGLLGGVAGAEIASVPAAFVGCGAGAIVGGIVGGAIAGVPTAGIAAVPGAAAGGLAGCLIGLSAAAVPALVVGAAAGAVLGGTTAGALGGGVDVPQPVDVPPLIEVAAPVDNPPAPPDAVHAIEQQINAIADTFASASPQADAAIDSLKSAIAAMPALPAVVLVDG